MLEAGKRPGVVSQALPGPALPHSTSKSTEDQS